MPWSEGLSKISIAWILSLFYFYFSPAAFGQTPQGPGPEDEVVRVFTELVQTDVMVFDKQGKFVNNLRREDFELRIDSNLKPIEFFERVTSGTAREEAQLAAARGGSLPEKTRPNVPVPLDRGRTVFFYIDDLHLDLSGVQEVRKVITKFLENEMGQNDEAAIASASGQIGFLQQLTDHKTVLRSALARLKPRPYSVRDNERPPMSEYQGMLIDRYDSDVTTYYVDALIRENPLMSRDMAENMVRGRASRILQQSAQITLNTLSGLEGLVRSATSLPGRKLVFFLSGGFFLDHRNSDSLERLQRITSAAARSGVVVYSMDARGLVASLSDASTDIAFDPSGRLERAAGGELAASQDGLNALAADTGGRAIFNTNALETGMKNALNESSAYYLLAWKPEQKAQSKGRFRRLEVRIPARPDLSVRVRRGFFDVEPGPVVKDDGNPKAAEKTSAAKLREVIGLPYPKREIPVSVGLAYVTIPNKGEMLSTSLRIPREFLLFSPTEGKWQAVVDVAGSVYNDQGQAGANFNERIVVTAPSVEAINNSSQELAYVFTVYVGPGLYQVRVAARDTKSGKTGAAHGWIEVPNLALGELAASSLLLGKRLEENTNTSNGEVPASGLRPSIDHRFPHNSYLRFAVFLYNAKRPTPTSPPDVAIQVQVLRDNQPVVTTTLRKVSTDGVPDLSRLPYAAEIPLENLPLGRYVLRVTFIDRLSKRSVSQHTTFEVE